MVYQHAHSDSVVHRITHLRLQPGFEARQRSSSHRQGLNDRIKSWALSCCVTLLQEKRTSQAAKYSIVTGRRVARCTSPRQETASSPSETQRCFRLTGGSRVVFGFSPRLDVAAVGRPDAERPVLSTQAVQMLSEILERGRYLRRRVGSTDETCCRRLHGISDSKSPCQQKQAITGHMRSTVPTNLIHILLANRNHWYSLKKVGG